MKTVIILTTLLSACPGIAFASNCETYSDGLSFSGQGFDSYQASASAVQACQTNPYTDNNECAANVSCDQENQPVMECNSSSNGLNFTAESSDENQASQSAVEQCQANPYTDNNVCANSVVCAGVSNPGTGQPFPIQPPPPPPTSGPDCVIRSGGNAFGQQTFNVMTPSGAIIGTFYSSEEAANFAQSDQRCY